MNYKLIMDQIGSSVNGDEIAYLALTSKIEHHFRDLYCLEQLKAYNNSDSPKYPVREYKRVDMVTFVEDDISDLIEFKSGYVFDVIDNPKPKNDAINWLKNDFDKKLNLEFAENTNCQQTNIIFLVDVDANRKITTKSTDRYIKYSNLINRFHKNRNQYNILPDMETRINKSFLNSNIEIYGELLTSGHALDCKVDIYYFILEKKD